ncbi:MAG: helix-turn-helix domain-containing protein [Myxococcales bacterium]|nr:helix-turn-helix domain-containing protein [Myxococcales bacterium]
MLSLEDLEREVAHLLAERGLFGASPDARVSAAPDARTVRYYTTLGLLDRPTIENRQARYGERHVLQLLAIKALQARDLPLAGIQQALYGRSDEELRQIVESLPPPQTAPALPALIWREVVIEPGLRVMAQDGWEPAPGIEQRISAAIAALKGGRR